MSTNERSTQTAATACPHVKPGSPPCVECRLLVTSKLATNTARPPLAKVAPIGLAPEHSFIHEANRIMRWDINAAGGAHVDEVAVDRVDRMVSALIQISNGWCVDPKAVAKEALS